MIKEILHKIERKRNSDNVFWHTLVSLKDIAWKISTFHIFLKENKIIPWKTNKNKIEIELTTFCNLNCINCNRSIRQAPTNEYMDIAQIEKFVKESLDLKWKWKHIRILGGEPTLHPQFFQVLETLKKYKNFNPKTSIVIVTNGYGKKVNDILFRVPSWVVVENTHKESFIQTFDSFNKAPIDQPKYKKEKYKKACSVTDLCGIGLTKHGYYICGVGGAGIDRIFGFDIGIKKLSEVKDSKLKKQRKILCKYCGHYGKQVTKNKNWISEEKISPIWKKSYENYKKQKPKLRSY